MFTSRIHKETAQLINIIYDISVEDVLSNPENYLGVNYKKVLDFWCHLDTLSDAQLRVVDDLFNHSNYDKFITAEDVARKAVDGMIYLNNTCMTAVCAARKGLAAVYATWEIAGNVENHFFTHMFVNPYVLKDDFFV
jgi:hypothetical protein